MTAIESARDSRHGDSLGIYLHVPFCRTRCRYCDFYRVGARDDRLQAFVASLEREIDSLAAQGPWAVVSTVFFGGGTPSLLVPEQIESVLGRLGDVLRVSPEAEVTLEANPSDLSRARLAGYRQAGINRLSLGVQSFQDRELALLGRRHDGRRATAAVEWARQAGIENVSIDLMLGTPGQTRGGLASTLRQAATLGPSHLSAYILEVHEGSEIDGLRRRRPGLFPGTEAQRSAYRTTVEHLTREGYEHYEISNFARPGRRSEHNLRYWRLRDVLGLGPSAHSSLGGRRWRNPADLVRYLEDPCRREELAPDSGEEALFLGLRLSDGLALERAATLLGTDPPTLIETARALEPYLEVGDGRLRLTFEGFLVSTSVLGELLELRARSNAPAPAMPRAG